MELTQQALKPLRFRELIWRGLYAVTYKGAEYTVEVDYFDFLERIRLYCDGILVDTQKSPARFVLEDNTIIEATLSLYGMKTARLTSADRSEPCLLTPLPGTAEARRASFSQQHPIANRTIAFFSWIVLAIALITQIPNIANSIGYFAGFSFPSFGFPDAVNIFLSIAGILAGFDRGLRMKYHPLLDN